MQVRTVGCRRRDGARLWSASTYIREKTAWILTVEAVPVRIARGDCRCESMTNGII